MLEALYPLTEDRVLTIHVAREGENRLRLTVVPKLNQNENAALGIPLQAVGTPQELEAQLPGAIADWRETRAACTTNLAAIKEASDAAAKKATEDAKARSKTHGKAAAGAAAAAATPAKADPPKPARVSLGGLFDTAPAASEPEPAPVLATVGGPEGDEEDEEGGDAEDGGTASMFD